jgi:hypothetical protein
VQTVLFEVIPVPQHQSVYRAFRNAACVDRQTGQIQTSTFLRRPNERGLSVSPTPDLSVRALTSNYGCCVLITGQIRTIANLEVSPTSNEHADIIGVPLRTENEQLALDIATALVDIAGAHSSARIV